MIITRDDMREINDILRAKPDKEEQQARRDILAALDKMIRAKKSRPRVPFFRNPHHVQALLEEIESWHGTRFWAQAGARAKKGIGADCVSWAEKVMVNIHALKPIEWPEYVVTGGGEIMLGLLLNSMDQVPELGRVYTFGDSQYPPLIVGDIFVRSVEAREDEHHHVAIYEGHNTLRHMRRRGLSRANIFDTYSLRKVQAIFRVYESKP